MDIDNQQLPKLSKDFAETTTTKNHNNNNLARNGYDDSAMTQPSNKISTNGPSTWVQFDDSKIFNNTTTIEDRANHLEQQRKKSLTPPFATLEITPQSVQLKSGLNENNSEITITTQPSINQYTSSQNSKPSGKSFENGDIIVTLLPLNDRCAWVTPATFKPHLVPEELMAQPLTLTVEDYVTTMSQILNDFRFQLYITLQKRVLALWSSLSIMILLAILFFGSKGLSVFIAAMMWLLFNAFGAFFVIYIKKKLYNLLEHSIAQVNANFSRHHIFLGVDDRGHFSCHKINLIFVYFDSRYCLKFLQDMLKNDDEVVTRAIFKNENIEENNVYITGSSGTKQISKKEAFGEKLLFRYSQRWIREYCRQQMTLSPRSNSTELTPQPPPPISNVSDIPPRHCRSAKCFCQFIEEKYRLNQQKRKQRSTIFEFFRSLLPCK